MNGAVDRLRFIQGSQRLGLRLGDIRDLLAVHDTGTCPCEPAEDLLTRRTAELDAEITRLSALRREMAAMLAGLSKPECPAPVPGTWVPTVRGEEVSAMDPVETTDSCCDDCPPKPATPAAADLCVQPPGPTSVSAPGPNILRPISQMSLSLSLRC